MSPERCGVQFGFGSAITRALNLMGMVALFGRALLFFVRSFSAGVAHASAPV
jgi:hypothetical protein